jgi:hypothetical protein
MEADMPRRKRPGKWSVIFAEVPPELKDWLDAQARASRRSTTAELMLLLETHLNPAHKPAPPPAKPRGRRA